MNETERPVSGVVKVEEFLGTSERSFSDAVRNVVRRASKTIRHIRDVEVVRSSADVGADGELSLYKVHCRVSFVVEEPTAR
jgi:flavin-binding protein dodecin